MASRYDIRRKLERLLALAARPGTPAEGEAALAAAERLAARHGFAIVKRVRRSPLVSTPHRGNETARVGYCWFCGARFFRAPTGRPRLTCSVRCRVAMHRHGGRPG